MRLSHNDELVVGENVAKQSWQRERLAFHNVYLQVLHQPLKRIEVEAFDVRGI